MYTPPTPEEINQLVCDFISRVREIEKSKKTDPFAGKPLFLQPDKADKAEDEPQYANKSKVSDKSGVSDKSEILDRVATQETKTDAPVALSEKSDPLAELEAMTGIAEVKAEVRRQLAYRRVMAMRKAMGVEIPKRLPHMLLTGNPGTGKTTVARLIARIFVGEGILRGGAFVEVNRATLVGRYIGETEEKILAKIHEAHGGVLFIDEMYSLTADDSDSKDFGHRVIEALMPVLSDENANVMVIGAGYPDSIKRMLATNPGLTSRFPTVIDFKDFTGDELMEIAMKRFAKFGFEVSPEAEQRLTEVISRLRKRRYFGNARDIVTMIENHVIPNFCTRVEDNYNSVDDNFLNVILPSDIPDVETMFPLSASKEGVGFRASLR